MGRLSGSIRSNDELYSETRRIIGRLDSIGDGDSAERLRVAMAGATSGEIFGDLRFELGRLLRTSLRDDPQVGAGLADAYRAVDEALRRVGS